MKKILSVVLAFAIILTVAATAFAAPPANIITSEQAKEIALEHAGYTADQVKFTKVRLDFDDGRYEYEVEFRVDRNTEYDYTILADNGAIVEYDMDIDGSDFFSIAMIIEWIKNLFSALFGR